MGVLLFRQTELQKSFAALTKKDKQRILVISEIRMVPNKFFKWIFTLFLLADYHHFLPPHFLCV